MQVDSWRHSGWKPPCFQSNAMRFVWFLSLFPVCASWFWIWETEPLRLTKDNGDSCDFESSRCDVTFYQASDWYRGHEHRWYHWLQGQILNSLHEFLRNHPNVEWTHQSGVNKSLTDHGPRVDHTTGTLEGYYMFLHPELNDGHHVSVLLQSRNYVTSFTSICFKYWYQMTGDATLLLAVVEKNHEGRDVKVLQDSTLRTGISEDGEGWKESVHTLTVPADKPFKVAIIGSVRDFRSGSQEDSVAVDDISIIGGSCRNNELRTLRRRNREKGSRKRRGKNSERVAKL